MPQHVSDEVLDLFAVVGRHEEIAARLLARFGDVVTHCEFSIAVKGPGDKERLAQIAAAAQARPSDAVRQRLTGPST
jgi:hypothetical protein